MLLTISTTGPQAADFSFLLHKHPDRFQRFELSFGNAYVFYRDVSDEHCTVVLLLDVDPVGMVRNRQAEGKEHFSLGQYVNDRPYVGSSFLSVAIAQVFGTAMAGRCRDRPALASQRLPLRAQIEVLPVRGHRQIVRQLFEPLGYCVEISGHVLDETFPQWGESPYCSVTLQGVTTLSELLTHLYVLIPVFDNYKHYFVGQDELDKLLEKGAGWLAQHPEKDSITRRFLRNRRNLYQEALARLVAEEECSPYQSDGSDQLGPTDQHDQCGPPQPAESSASGLATSGLQVGGLSLDDQRRGTVLAALKAAGARSVLDLGCGEGKFLSLLLEEEQFERILGLDVSMLALQRASRRLRYETLPPQQRQRLTLLHGSLIYRDKRLAGFDAAAAIEVIEHLDPPRLRALERILFELTCPQTIAITTPNWEYNILWESLPAGTFRHHDHRFEWTRQEFRHWASQVADQHGYQVRFVPIGPEHDEYGPPTQMGVFQRA